LAAAPLPELPTEEKDQGAQKSWARIFLALKLWTNLNLAKYILSNIEEVEDQAGW